jgi:hypothetical protein
MTKQLTRHPLSAAMGEMEPESFIELQTSVGKIGVLEPILIFEGKVLDGWNRYQAALGLGVDAPQEPFTGTFEEACLFVWAKHGARRNWTPSQRALAQAEIARLRGDTAPGAVSETVRKDAERADVSPRTMAQANVVARRAAPEVKRKVMDGEMSLKQAERIARLPRPEQRKAITQPPAAVPQRATRWAPASPPKPQVGASKEALEDMREALAVMGEENERLTNRLAAAAMEATEEERALALSRMDNLLAELKTERAAHAALKAVHRELQGERNELLKQCAMYRSQLTKYTAKAA